jgi:membrane-associated phospholipid phosphatase
MAPSSRSPALRREQLWTAGLLTVGLTAGFYALDWYNAARLAAGRRFWELGFAWEERVPLAPEWVWIYFLYFPACLLPLLLAEIRRDVFLFRRTALGFALQFVVAYPFFLLPIRMRQPEIIPTTLSEEALRWFYSIDPGFNVFPSLHVANTAYVASMLTRLRGGYAAAGAWALCALIAVSTLFVKQHYFVDLPVGVLLGVWAERVAFYGMRQRVRTPQLSGAARDSSA